MYPFYEHIPEGRWVEYEISLPNQPYHPVIITFEPLTPTIILSHEQLTFAPDAWNISQILTVFAIDDELNRDSPYEASFSLSLVSLDDNYNGTAVEDFNVTVEDNDDSKWDLMGRREWKGIVAQCRWKIMLGFIFNILSNVNHLKPKSYNFYLNT